MNRFSASRVRALSLALASALLASCASTGPITTGELRVLQWGNVIKVEGAAGGRTLNSIDLAPVPSMPLLGVINPISAVDMVGTNVSLAPIDSGGQLLGPQIEAHLFVDNLADTNEYLRGVGAASAVQQWDDRATIGHRGMGLAVPYPPNTTWPLGKRYQVGPPVLPLYFWPNIEPEAPGSDPEGTGSIKSVRIYKPGLCGVEVAFTQPDNQGLFDQVSDTLWQKFSSNGSLSSPVRAYSRATTLLDEGVDIFGPRGGFFLYFWFAASAGGGFQSVNFAANYEYQFTLNDGRLVLDPTRDDLLVQPQSHFTDFRDALEKELPESIADNFRNRQQAPPPGPGDVAPLCDAGNDRTATARSTFASGARNGGAMLGYSQGDQDALANAVSQPGNWICGSDNRARFTLRAKRINVYEDAVELVWFDKADVNDPMYALYVAAVRAGGNLVSSLCARPRTLVGGTGLLVQRRPIVSVAR